MDDILETPEKPLAYQSERELLEVLNQFFRYMKRRSSASSFPAQ